MNRESFEQLICEALDDLQRAALREEIERAIAASPELAAVRDEWVRFDALMREAFPAPTIDWTRLRAAIADGVAGAGRLETATDSESALDALISGSTDVAHTVNWSRLQTRISNSIDSRGRGSAKRLRLVRWSMLGFAAAASLVLILMWPGSTTPSSTVNLAQSQVPEPTSPKPVIVATVRSADRSPSASPGRVVASITAIPASIPEKHEEAPRPASSQNRFVMIDTGDVSPETETAIGF